MSATKNINIEKINGLAKTNLSGTTAPTTTDDSSLGYGSGSFWIDTVADKVYFCTDATISAATWVDVSNSGATDTNFYVTGGTVVTNTMYLDRNDTLSAATVDVSSLTTDTYVTGFTYDNSNNLSIGLNDDSNISVNVETFSGLTTDVLNFNTGYTGNTIVEGRMYWDEENQTVSLGLHNNEVSLQLGQETHYLIKNQSGATIENGRVVRAAGTLGSSGRILGEYMIADGSIPPKFTLGIATQDILNGDDGYVTEFGLVRGLNTTGSLYGETWNDGDVLWVSPTVPGGLTNVEPLSPNLHIEVAIVIDADANGSLFVRPHRYPYSYDLQDMGWSAGTESNLDVIQWDSVAGYFNLTNTPNFNSLSATTISGDTYYGDGSNLTGIDSTNIYTDNGVLTGDRIVEQNSNKLTFHTRLSGTTDRIEHYYNNTVGGPVTDYYNRWGTRFSSIGKDSFGNFVSGVGYHSLGLDVGPKSAIEMRYPGGTGAYLKFSNQFSSNFTQIGQNVPHFFLAQAGALSTNKFIVGDNSVLACEDISLQGKTLISDELVIHAPTTPVTDGCHINDSYSFYIDSGELKGRYKNNLGVVSNLIIGAGTTNWANTLWVDPNGDDAEGTKSDITKPYLTLEAAKVAATSGDTIIVNAGAYTATTTDANGLAKDGVSWVSNGTVYISKATTGPLWRMDHTFTSKLYVDGDFRITHTGADDAIIVGGNGVNMTSDLGCHIKITSLTTSSSNCIYMERINPTNHAYFYFYGEYIATGGSAFRSVNTVEDDSRIHLEGFFRSTNTHGIYSQDDAMGVLIGDAIGAGVGNGVNIGAQSDWTCTGNYEGATYGVSVTNGRLIVNGVTFGAVAGGGTTTSLTVNGIVKDNPLFLGGNNAYIQQAVGCDVTCNAGFAVIDNFHLVNTNSEIDISGGQLNVKNVTFTGNYSAGANYRITGGVLIWEADITTANINTPDEIFELTSGKLVLRSCIINMLDTGRTTRDICAVRKTGGDLVLDNVTILGSETSGRMVPIIADGSAQDVVVYQARTNRFENGPMLSGKNERYIFTVSSVATTNITINGETFQETDTTTYNTEALLAQRMASLINGSGTLTATASQDTPGTDTYFYVTSDDFDRLTLSGISNLSREVLCPPSYPFTDVVGGTIIEDIDVI